MNDDITTARADLRRLFDMFKLSQAIYVLVTTGVADLLKDGPHGSDDIAARAGLQPRRLYRLLRVLASSGILEELDGRRFQLTALGEGLRSDAPSSVAGWVEYMGGALSWQTWGSLAESIRSGKTAYQLLFGTDAWSYRAQHPDIQAVFDRAMFSATALGSEAVLNAYDFSRFHRVVDVAGGTGAFLGALLAHHGGATGVLFDQAQVVAAAEPVLRQFGVLDRCRIESGSFFEAVPGGGDVYVLKAIIHDWDDADAVRILTTCRKAMQKDAVLLLIERVLQGRNESLEDALSDLMMLVALGGMERSGAEFEALLSQAGLKMVSITPTTGFNQVIEAAPI